MGSKQRLSETATVIMNAQVDSSTNQTEDGQRPHLWCRSSTGLERPSFYRHQRLTTPSFQKPLENVGYLFVMMFNVHVLIVTYP